MEDVTRKIFVADDDPVLLRGLDLALTGRGYVVRTALSGAHLLELLEYDRPDLLVLDVMMPGMSGLEVLRRIRGDGRWPNLPVMVVTARSDAVVVREAQEGGAADVVGKPFRLRDLVGKIEQQLGGAGPDVIVRGDWEEDVAH